MLIGIQTAEARLGDLIRNKNSTGSWTRGHCTLVENLSAFYPCPETLQKNEIKGDRLNNLVEEISSQY